MELIKTAHAKPLNELLPLGLGKWGSFGELLSSLVAPAFTVAVTAVFVYMVWGGFRWLTSGGDKDTIAGARNMITHAIIGLVLLILLFFIVEAIPMILGINPREFSVTGKQ